MTVAIGRRELLAALGGGVIVWPVAARAQQQAESGSSNFATDRVTPSRDNQILCHENHFCIGIYSLFTTLHYHLCLLPNTNTGTLPSARTSDV